MKRTLGLGLLGLAVATAAVAHPHFNKTLTATLAPNVEATIAYNTVPANETHAQTAKVGDFITPRRPSLKLSAEVKAGTQTLPAGEYTIGAIKTGAKDWVLALYPGKLDRSATPDPAKAIRLDSMFATDKGTAEHTLIDITPGTGKFAGKAVLTLHFGSLFLAGALS